ncbi:hypothetical protein C8Q76DRAFT_5296 [Earliella scabrosa]|nr:hypothetical protein C8Q76DRAFT_5296 [Earliella scabrosa]
MMIKTCVIGAQYSTAYRHGRPLTREQLILVLLLAMDAFAHSKPRHAACAVADAADMEMYASWEQVIDSNGTSFRGNDTRGTCRNYK